jgi:hypothetical protein
MASQRPSLSITLPDHDEQQWGFLGQIPKTPEPQTNEAPPSPIGPPPPPRAQPFKVRRRRTTIPHEELDTLLSDTGIIPTIEMTEVPAQSTSSSMLSQSPRSARLLSPMDIRSPFTRAVTPPKTPAPRHVNPLFSQLESPIQEWDLINETTRPFHRSSSICSSFSDSSLSSCGSSAFSMPTTGACDSPRSESTDPFVDDEASKVQKASADFTSEPELTPQAKRLKVRRVTNWTAQMDQHLWMTFMAYLSDPTLTPFKLLPGSTPPMGVCDQVATRAKRTWRSRKTMSLVSDSIENVLGSTPVPYREGSPDTIRPTALQSTQSKWPKNAATRRRLRHLCQNRPSISAHYQRMLRTRSPSPFETSTPPPQTDGLRPSIFSSHAMIQSLVTSTAPSMQPDGPLAQLARDPVPAFGSIRSKPPPAMGPLLRDSPPAIARPQRATRPDDWYACIGRSQAHKKSQSLQSELRISSDSMHVVPPSEALASPFNFDSAPSRSHLLSSMSGTKSLGRTEMNGRSLASPLVFKQGAPTERRSRKRRFRSDEEKPRRPALEDVFGPPDHTPVTRNRGFTVGAARATDNLSRLFTPTVSVPTVDEDMTEAPGPAYVGNGTPLGSRTAPRRLAEPVPRLGSPFLESPFPGRQRNTFPRGGSNQTPDPFRSFHDRLLDAANQPSFLRRIHDPNLM